MNRIPPGFLNLSPPPKQNPILKHLQKPVDFTKKKNLSLKIIRLVMTFLSCEQFLICRCINKFMRENMSDKSVVSDHLLRIFERTILLRQLSFSPCEAYGFEQRLPNSQVPAFMHDLCLETQLFALEMMRDVYLTKGDHYQPDCPGILKNVRYMGKNSTHAFIWSHGTQSMIPIALPEGIIGRSIPVTIDEEELKRDKENAEGCLKEALSRFVFSEIHMSENYLYMANEMGLTSFVINGKCMQLSSFLRLPFQVNYKVHTFHIRNQGQDFLYVYSRAAGLNSHASALSWLVGCDKKLHLIMQFDSSCSNKPLLSSEFCHATGEYLIGLDKSTSTGTLRAFIPNKKGMNQMWEYQLRGLPIQEVCFRRSLTNSAHTPTLKLELHSDSNFVVVHYELSSFDKSVRYIDVLDVSSGTPKVVLFIDSKSPQDLTTIHVHNGVLSARRLDHTIDCWDLKTSGKPLHFGSFQKKATSQVLACTTISSRKVRFLQLDLGKNGPLLSLNEHTTEKPKGEDPSRPLKRQNTNEKRDNRDSKDDKDSKPF